MNDKIDWEAFDKLNSLSRDKITRAEEAGLSKYEIARINDKVRSAVSLLQHETYGVRQQFSAARQNLKSKSSR